MTIAGVWAPITGALTVQTVYTATATASVVVMAVLAVLARKAARDADEKSLKIATSASDIEGVKLSVSSLEAALARSDIEVKRQDVLLTIEREATRKLQQEVIQLRSEFAAERRACADRVKVLVRQIHRMGGTEEPAE